MLKMFCVRHNMVYVINILHNINNIQTNMDNKLYKLYRLNKAFDTVDHDKLQGKPLVFLLLKILLWNNLNWNAFWVEYLKDDSLALWSLNVDK